MKVTFNSPVILYLTILSLIVLGIKFIFGEGLFWMFTSPGYFNASSIWDYIRLVSYCLGHANFAHFLANFSLILLLGPILERRFGSRELLLLIMVTVLATSLLHTLFFNERLTGISGVVFMFISLVPLQEMKKGSLPLTFILVVLIYLGQEVFSAISKDSISQFAHIMGGVLGIVFGTVYSGRKKTQKEGDNSGSIF